jgi:hypothetical protein
MQIQLERKVDREKLDACLTDMNEKLDKIGSDLFGIYKEIKK